MTTFMVENTFNFGPLRYEVVGYFETLYDAKRFITQEYDRGMGDFTYMITTLKGPYKYQGYHACKRVTCNGKQYARWSK